jgi:signal peptidase I
VSDVIRAGGPTERSSGGWASPASFALCTFYVSLVLWLTVWVLLPTGLMGLRPMLVTSGSMEPLIRTGDVVLIGDHDAEDLAPGTVVTFHDASRDGRLVTHRIEAVGDDGSYTTRGDANRSPDATPVRPDDVVGVGRLLVPMIGIPLTWLHGGDAPLFLVWLVATLLAVVVAARSPDDRSSPDVGTVDTRDDEGEPASTATAGHLERPRHRWGRPGRATSSLVLGLALVGALIPRTSAAFTATTVNGGSSFQAATALEAPTDLSTGTCRRDRGGVISVDLSWVAPTSGPTPEHYRVEWSVGGDPYETVGATPGTTLTVSGFQNNIPTDLRVVALADGSWDSPPSEALTVVFRGQDCR